MNPVVGEQALKARHLVECLVKLLGEVVDSVREDIDDHAQPFRGIRWEKQGRITNYAPEKKRALYEFAGSSRKRFETSALNQPVCFAGPSASRAFS